jgi:hypothetical protein
MNSKHIEASRIAHFHPRPTTRGYLYAIFSPTFPNHIKLGKSIEPSKRFLEYNNYNVNADWEFKYISQKVFEDYTEAETELIKRLADMEHYPIYNKEWYDSKHTQLIIRLIQELENQKHQRLLKN